MSELHVCFLCGEKAVEFDSSDTDSEGLEHRYYSCHSCSVDYEMIVFGNNISDSDSE